MEQEIQACEKVLLDLEFEYRNLELEVKRVSQEILSCDTQISEKEQRAVVLRMAEGVLQQIVDRVSGENFQKIEFLVNRALSAIFTDLNLIFKITSEIKRQTVVYSFQIEKDGIPGNINSLGGGIIVVVAVVLKLLFNIISRRFPLLVLDETLSFLATSYIPAMSEFLKEVSKEFDIPILMVTHQEEFAVNSDKTYKIEIKDKKTVLEMAQ
jgi:ABC-type dipeptide/oligopeptide/nickel transport system ATPase subunit